MSSVVPEGWSMYALGELGQVVGGGTPPSETLSYWGGSVMWATPAEITKLKSRYINKTLRTITKEGLQKSSAKLHPKGTILLTSRASIGYPAINSVPMATNQGFQSLRPNEKLDVEYGYQLILNNRNGLERLSAGSTFLEISSKEINKYKLPIPPLPEQKKIASILTSVDEVIENTQKQIDKLQDLKKATMNELLTKGIGHTEFKDSELGRIPKSWEVVRFQEVFESYTYGPRFSSKDYSPIGNVKTIRGTDLTKDWCINYKQVPLAELDEKVVLQHRLKENDVVMITTADCGFSAVFKEQSIPFIASAYAIRLRPTLRINSSFCVCYLQTSIAKNQIEKYERKGTVSNLPGSDVMNVRLPLPSLDEQSEIVSALTSIDTNISNNLEKLSQTQSLKKSLMQDLLTGKVRVTVN